MAHCGDLQDCDRAILLAELANLRAVADAASTVEARSLNIPEFEGPGEPDPWAEMVEALRKAGRP